MSGWSLLFMRGFRVFFLAAGGYAVLAMGLWVGALLVPDLAGWLGSGFPAPSSWHAHEMLFGFAGATVAGFLLTAVPNWTGSDYAEGRPVLLLAAAWLVGRVAVWAAAVLPAGVVGAADLLFLPGLAFLVLRPILARRQWRNIAFPVLLGLLWCAQALVHAERLGLVGGGAAVGHRLALAVFVGMVVVVGGRIVPNFTAGFLRQQGKPVPVMRPPWVEAVVLATTAGGLLGDLVGLPALLAGGLAAAAAVAHAVRMSGWQTRAVLGEPMVWVLHLGYGWLIVAFAVKALALSTSLIAETTALHGFAVGVIGTMVLAVMSRAALGHAGRPLVAPRLVIVGYGLITVSAILRLVGPELPGVGPTHAVLGAGGLWVVAFGLFVATYAPILTRPRADGMPG